LQYSWLAEQVHEPAVHTGVVPPHAPSTHDTPGPQAFPHEPQLEESERTSTQMSWQESRPFAQEIVQTPF
jgi:hypothetical protein